MRDGRSRRAISLVEVLIVVLIVGIVAAVAVHSMSPATAEQLRGAGESLVSDLAYVRSLAVSNGSTYRLTFDTTNNEYFLEHTGSNSALDVLPDGPFGHGGDPPTRNTARLAEHPGFGLRVRMELVTVGGVEATFVEFGPLGQTTASEQSVIWLSAGAGNETRYISARIDPVTGLAELGQVQAAAPQAGEGGGDPPPGDPGFGEGPI